MERYVNVKTQKWFIEKSSQMDEFRLFIFHHAGGAATYYMPMFKYFPENFGIYLVQLPGREYRINDKFYVTLNTMIDDLVEVIKPYLDKPFAFFGHSMGAMIAFELTHKLKETYGKIPRHLFLSSMCAPHLEKKSNYQSISDQQLLSDVFDLGGMNLEASKDKKLMNLILPILRNDLQLCDDYYCCSREPLNIPVTILGGHDDKVVNACDLLEWDKYFKNVFNVCIFKGNHFYFKDDFPLLVTTVMKMLRLRNENEENGGRSNE